MKFSLPLEPEAAQVLETWESAHRVEAGKLLLGFGKLHLAINAQRSVPSLEELKSLLSSYEDEMLDWFLSVENAVNILREGYGGPAAIAQYYAAITEMPKHQRSRTKLHRLFNLFLDE